ncbi:WD40 repeat-like protein [Rhizoclosmatium globosum]|uniref:WD40 repeat-like protein n=1 Tax=Rhizoclosmatium globosum TaxID=329046 RepID=A0A1Y2C6S1_9FUNG|nr:WD40 repeat-like protein [Rhizoclosmatium globosum]|eukprot:ORY42729.1 WD40 repeat-like protein [Rhizoclosmatium globosum]
MISESSGVVAGGTGLGAAPGDGKAKEKEVVIGAAATGSGVSVGTPVLAPVAGLSKDGISPDRELRVLKQRVVELEKENAVLKKSLFDLSVRFTSFVHLLEKEGEKAKGFTFDLATLDDDADLIDSLVGDVAGPSNLTETKRQNNNSQLNDDVDAMSASNINGNNANNLNMTSNSDAPDDSTLSSAPSTNPTDSSLNQSSVTNSTALPPPTIASPPPPPHNIQALIDKDPASSSTSTPHNRQFYLKQELKGHQGAVYAIQFSPCGRFVATGSFDKSVRIWESPTIATSNNALQILKRHSLNISDLCWSEDSTLLLSGAYDQTCKTWDIENSKFLESFDCDGFVQCVQFNPIDKNQFYYGTTRNVLGMTDRRTASNAITIHNDGMINSVHVFKDNSYVLTADSNGFLKTWDIRAGKALQVLLNEPTRKPISHISVCPMANGDEEPRYIGVNSYDNVMRVYDRGFAPPEHVPRMVHALKGYKNKNWPIKSSFHRLKEAAVSSTKRTNSTDDLFIKGDALFDGSDFTQTTFHLETSSMENQLCFLQLEAQIHTSTCTI